MTINVLVASTITVFPMLCPNLQQICLQSLPRDPTTAAAVSDFLLTINRGALQSFCAGSPLMEEASEVVSELPDLCSLAVVVEGDASSPSLVLPNLRGLVVSRVR